MTSGSENEKTFFERWAFTILLVIIFMVPFSLRGARMSLRNMKNDVKDWLPSDFSETKDLEWFGKHFMGERFIVATWPGCTESDPRFQLMVQKLKNEVAPSKRHAVSATTTPADPQAELREKARRLGDTYGLALPQKDFENWGGLGEKWFHGYDETWFYITPDGKFYRWKGSNSLPGWVGRTLERIGGKQPPDGELIEDLGVEGQQVCEFHADPRLLTARLFGSITTGPQVLNELSAPGGALWPIGSEYSDEEKPAIARQKALERLTGTLFGPPAYDGFRWTIDDFEHRIGVRLRAKLPENWQDRFSSFVSQLVRNSYNGERQELVDAPAVEQREHWNALFAKLDTTPPERLTCIVLTMSEAGNRNLAGVIGRPDFLGRPTGRLVDLAINECGIAVDDFKLGGPPVDNVAIDEEGQITLGRLIGWSCGLGLLLAYLCFRSVKITSMVFFVGGVAATSSLAIVWWLGAAVDAVLMSMPSLVYVLGLSGAVHIVNYYRDAVHDSGLRGAPEAALRHGAWPCTLAAFTTSLGLLSLCTSNILPIKKFGFFSALGVFATLSLLFTYLPSALQTWNPGYHKREQDQPSRGLQKAVGDFWQRVGGYVVRRYAIVASCCLLGIVAFGFGLPKINTSVQLLKLFDSEAKIIRDYNWLEANLGKLVPMELVVRVDPDAIEPTALEREKWEENDSQPANLPDQKFQLTLLERLELVAQVHDAVEDEFGPEGQDIVGRATSSPTFAPDLPPPGAYSVLDPFRAVFNRKMEENYKAMQASDYLRIDRSDKHLGSELWRISLRLGALNDVDYGEFVSELKRAVEPVVSGYHYRTKILRAVDKQNDGQGYAKGRVLFLGVDPTKPKPAESQPAESQVAEADTHQAQRHVNHVSGFDQTWIFSQTVRHSMKNAGIAAQWHDPETVKLTADKWQAAARAFDCIVLVNDHADYDLEMLQANANQFVDARWHRFQPEVGLYETANSRNEDIQVVYTGVVPVVYKAQRTLLDSLINSIGWAFVMIAIVMMFLLRNGQISPLNVINARAGLISMAPNVFPVILIFGGMGHLGVAVDIGSMMTASVAMGVAVDDTIHFLNWFRRGIAVGMTRSEAIMLASHKVATAMTQTTLIGGLGLAVFAFSTFTPTQQFGVLMLSLLAAALVGDLFMLPALLASPLGKYFCPKVIKPEASNPPAETNTASVDAENAGPLDEPDGERATVTPHSRQRGKTVVRQDDPH